MARSILRDAAIIKVDYKDAAAISALKPAQVEGRVVIAEIPDFRSAAREQRMEMYQAQSAFMSKVSALKAALVISVDRLNAVGNGSGQGRLIDPENPRTMVESSNVPLITVHHQKVVNLYDALKAGRGSG